MRPGPPPPTLPVGPAGRLPAPGRLGLLQAFVNTVDLEHDRRAFDDAAGLARWLVDHGLAERADATAADFERAITLREALRAMLRANNGSPREPAALGVLAVTAARAPLRISFPPGAAPDADRPQLVSTERGVRGALATLVGIAYDAMLDGTWTRLKSCRREVCHWAFYDTSRNSASTWCSMSICGSRAKAQAYRRRRSGR